MGVFGFFSDVLKGVLIRILTGVILILLGLFGFKWIFGIDILSLWF